MPGRAGFDCVRTITGSLMGFQIILCPEGKRWKRELSSLARTLRVISFIDDLEKQLA
jgi:hypothetical protein